MRYHLSCGTGPAPLSLVQRLVRQAEEEKTLSRSLAILMLGASCLLVIACQTAGTPPQSLAAAQTQAPPRSAKAAALPQALPPSAEAAALPQAPPPARSVNRIGTARSSGGVVPDISAQVKKFIIGAAKTGAIEYAAVAAIVIAVGATATVSVRRHRKLTPSSQ